MPLKTLCLNKLKYDKIEIYQVPPNEHFYLRLRWKKILSLHSLTYKKPNVGDKILLDKLLKD